MLDRETPMGDDFGEFGIPVHTLQKNNREQVRISLNEYKGVEYIDIRIFYQAKDEFKPTRRGVTVPKRLYPELLQGMIELGHMLGFEAPE
jgi:hypothetical protein